MKKNKKGYTGLSAFPSGEPAIMKIPGMQDGRYKEWQDRSRVNLEDPDTRQRSNIERDFEAEQREPEREDEQKFY